MLESRRYIHVRKNYFTLKKVLLYSVVLLFLARHEEVPIMLHRAKIMVSSKSNRVNQCVPGAYKAWVREFFQKPGGSQSSSITAKSQPNLDDDFPIAAQMEFHLQLSSHTLFTCQHLLQVQGPGISRPCAAEAEIHTAAKEAYQERWNLK